MAFTPVETIACVLIAIAAIKMVVLLIKPMAWMNFAKSIYVKPWITKVISLLLAAVVLYYLIDSGLSIIQILAVCAFVAMLFVMGLAEDITPFIKKYESQIKAGKMWQKHWLYTLIWIALLVWGVLVLFNVI